MKHFIFSLSIILLLGSCKGKLQCYECDLVGSMCATCKVVKSNGDVYEYATQCFEGEEVADGYMADWISTYEANTFWASQGTITCFSYTTKQNAFKSCLTKDIRDEELSYYEEDGFTCVEIAEYYK
jgi:hypothetical protein